MAPYLGKWVVKSESSSSLCNQGGENGYRDRAEISTDMNEHPRLPPWHNAFILFSKEGCTEVKHGSPQWGMSNNTHPSGGGKIVGVGIARQAKKRLTINQAPSGEIVWDSLGSHCSIPIDEANPDTFTLQLKIGAGNPMHAVEFERVNETPNRYAYQLLVGGRLPEGTNAVRFTVAASNDVHVGLSGVSASHLGEKYELVLGGWGNAQSVIRGANQGPDLVRVDTPELLCRSEARPFWVSWSDGHLRVGKGRTSSCTCRSSTAIQRPSSTCSPRPALDRRATGSSPRA
jgi:hypothetical protein